MLLDIKKSPVWRICVSSEGVASYGPWYVSGPIVFGIVNVPESVALGDSVPDNEATGDSVPESVPLTVIVPFI